jgi:hypothetical protein
MDGMIKLLMKRLLLLYVCSVGGVLLLTYGFSRAFFSPRGLGVALVILCIAIATGAVLINKTSAKEFAVPARLPGAAIDTVTRKRLLWRIRMAKTTIAIMGVGLVAGLTEARAVPFWEQPGRWPRVSALLVGVIMNLLITARSVQTVVRLKKILN